jgi:hypothetical protein
MRFGLVSDQSPASRRFPRKSGFVLPRPSACDQLHTPYQPLVEVVELEWQCPKLLA